MGSKISSIIPTIVSSRYLKTMTLLSVNRTIKYSLNKMLYNAPGFYMVSGCAKLVLRIPESVFQTNILESIPCVIVNRFTSSTIVPVTGPICLSV